MNIMLIYPPQGEPSYPPLGIPSITAALRSDGWSNITAYDLNILSFDHFLSEAVLSRAGRQVAYRLQKIEAGKRLPPEQIAEYRNLARAELTAEYTVSHIDEAKRILRTMGPDVDLERYQWAFRVIRAGLSLFSATIFPSELRPNTFHMRYSTASWRDVNRAAGDSHENPYISYFKEHFLAECLRHQPQVIGISVSWTPQLIPAITLARIIKAAVPKIHICLGGNLITHLADRIVRLPDFFKNIDSCIQFEGETAFSALCEAIERGGDLSPVPNAIWRENGVVRNNELRHIEDVQRLPTPDFTGFPLDFYLSPEPILPLATSRGCYWGRCAYCSHHFAYVKYRTRKPEQVVFDMQQLSQRHHTTNFFLMDDCPSPALLEQIASSLADQQQTFRWGAEVRMEKKFTAEFCQKLRQGGCRIVLFGLESANQRVLDLMNKGVRQEDLQTVIDNFHAADINVWLLFFLGFPGETESEARETLAFLLANRKQIVSASGGPFVLSSHSDVHRHPDQYGVTITPSPSEHDLALDFTYEATNALEPHTISRLLTEFFHGEGKEFTNIVQIEVHGLFLPHSSFKQGYLVEQHRQKFTELSPGWEDRPVRLRPTTRIVQRRFRITEGTASSPPTAADQPALSLYEGVLDQSSETAPAVQRLIALIDGQRTPRQLAMLLASGNPNNVSGPAMAIASLLRFRYVEFAD